MVKFDISQDNIQRDGAKALAEALHDNQIMKELNIASNSLGDAGAGALASALEAPSCALTSVDVSNNKLGDKGTKVLQQAAGGR